MLLLTAAGVMLLFRPGVEWTREGPGGTEEAAQARSQEARAGDQTAPARPLSADSVCPDAGYLCAGLTDLPDVRILRWEDTTQVIRVRIPAPIHEPPSRARALQEAAARGLRAWQDRPFSLRIDLSDVPGEHDFVVRWTDTLEERGLGRTRTRWSRTGGRAFMEVEDLVLATRRPEDGQEIPERALELAAAHEMGHALGLPHSDRKRDVMYPENTSTRPTARDYRTLEALYRLRNGAVIR